MTNFFQNLKRECREDPPGQRKLSVSQKGQLIYYSQIWFSVNKFVYKILNKTLVSNIMQMQYYYLVFSIEMTAVS